MVRVEFPSEVSNDVYAFRYKSSTHFDSEYTYGVLLQIVAIVFSQFNENG